MKKFLLGFMLVLATLFASVMAEESPRAVIIFDASGSMWGQIGGKAKIEIARDALKNVVKEWNPNVELGLTVYGHRKKGDCSDIETVIPVGKVDKNRVNRTVMSIKPKGKTPISRSLRKVAEEIKYTEEKATIILISDGKETCDTDPCGTAQELEKEGIDFITHVIGFNVDKKTDKQLECIAHATGGEYFYAKNAAALNEAMKVIAKKVEVVVPPKPKVKKLDHNIEVTASETEGGKWVKASHYLYQDEDGKPGERAGAAHSRKKDTGTDTLPVGKYIIKSSYNAFKRETPFEIKPSEVTKVHIIFSQTGTVEVSGSETEGGKWVSLYGYIYSVDEDGKKHGGNVGQVNNRNAKEPSKHKLPVGKYMMKVKYNNFEREVVFDVKAGKTTKVHMIFNPFTMEAKCVDKNTKISYEVYTSSGRLIFDKKIKCSESLSMVLDSGNYSVEAKLGDVVKTVKFSVDGGTSKLVIDMTDVKKEPTKEEFIKVDSLEEVVVVPVKPKPETSKKRGRRQSHRQSDCNNSQFEWQGK